MKNNPECAKQAMGFSFKLLNKGNFNMADMLTDSSYKNYLMNFFSDPELVQVFCRPETQNEAANNLIASFSNPQTIFAKELEALKEFGLGTEEENLNALMKTKGNVEEAVSLLCSLKEQNDSN